MYKSAIGGMKMKHTNTFAVAPARELLKCEGRRIEAYRNVVGALNIDAVQNVEHISRVVQSLEVQV